jgi:hypothetical protein
MVRNIKVQKYGLRHDGNWIRHNGKIQLAFWLRAHWQQKQVKNAGIVSYSLRMSNAKITPPLPRGKFRKLVS